MDSVAHLVKFNAQTNGRDKLCRVFQYSSKFLVHYLQKHAKDPDVINKFKILESNLSATRKLLRFGKSLDMVQGALKSMELQDPVLQLTLTLAKLNQAAFMLADHFIWFGKTGVIKMDSKYWAQVSARFWLVTIVFNLIRNLYDIANIIRATEKRELEVMSGSESKLISARGHQEQVENGNHKPIIVDTIKNSADLLLPLSSLGYIDISPGIQGILGVISSVMGILTVWYPDLKLVPS